MNSVPFPVEAPYRVKSDLVKLLPDVHGPVLFYDQLAQEYFEQKRCLIDNGHASEKSIFQVANSMGCDHVASTVAEIVTELGCKVPALTPDALALALQDDWVVMDENGVCQMLHVCFPSGWRPEEKVGLSMRQIHQPVADGAKLLAASDVLSNAMKQKGPFVRYVWTLSPEASLDRHPDRCLKLVGGTEGSAASAHSEIKVDQIWFRCERQVTVPLRASGRSLFLIRIFVAPLLEVCATTERRSLMKSSLASMSDAVVGYKGIADLRRTVLQSFANS
jgi:Protein of unknown function (DUF3445)